MALHSLSIGSHIRHPKYGDGIVLDNSMEAAYIVTFKNHGEKAISKDFEGIELIQLAPSEDNRLSIADFEQTLIQLLRKFNGVTEIAPIDSKWKGGKLIMEPGNTDLKGKELMIDDFFNKIIMVRDRLRVLEQNINSHKSLDKDEKIHLQQYITRAYGSLTTFNVMFSHKDDHFIGQSKKRD